MKPARTPSDEPRSFWILREDVREALWIPKPAPAPSERRNKLSETVISLEGMVLGPSIYQNDGNSMIWWILTKDDVNAVLAMTNELERKPRE